MLSVKDVKEAIPQLDHGMAEIITDMHNYGIITRFCCSGHSAPPGGASTVKDKRDPTGQRKMTVNRRQRPRSGYITLHHNPVLIQVIVEALLASPKFADFQVRIYKDRRRTPLIQIRGILRPGIRPSPHPTIFVLFLKLVVIKYIRIITQFKIPVVPQKLRVSDGIFALC